MIKKLLCIIFYIIAGIIIDIVVLYFFFRLTSPQKNSFTYSFSKADNVITNANSFFSNTKSKMLLYFDTSNLEGKHPCFFSVEFKNDDGGIILAGPDQDNATISTTIYNGYDNGIGNASETRYVIQFFPEDQEDGMVHFDASEYSLSASLRKNTIDLIDKYNLLLRTTQVNNQSIVNELDIFDGNDLHISGSIGMCKLNNFSITEMKKNDKGGYTVTNTYSFLGEEKEIFFVSYELTYAVSNKENTEEKVLFDNKMPVFLMYMIDVDNSEPIIMNSVKKFVSFYSTGTLLRYTTANPVEYKVDKQEVALYSKNIPVYSSRLTLDFDFTDTLGGIYGDVKIVEGDGTVAGKCVTPSFLDWFYENHYAIAIAVFTAIIEFFVGIIINLVHSILIFDS